MMQSEIQANKRISQLQQERRDIQSNSDNFLRAIAETNELQTVKFQGKFPSNENEFYQYVSSINDFVRYNSHILPSRIFRTILSNQYLTDEFNDVNKDKVLNSEL